MVPLHPEPAPSQAARLGATLLGKMALVGGPRRTDRSGPSTGPSLGEGGIPERGRPGPAARGVWRGRTRRGTLRATGAAETRGRRQLGSVRPAAPRGRGRHSSPAPSTITRHHQPLPTPLKTGPTGPGWPPPPTGTPLVPPGRASPPPRPSPQPDSPREYRDLGDSRSRSALSNEMKSEGIAARPSPARGQREGGSGGGGGTSSPGPRAPNRGRRGEGGCCCLLLEGSDFHRAEDRGNGSEAEGKLHGD